MFKVVRSSAGAGKTHALVKHYLGLCLDRDRPDAYRAVLALTFTNKAADEMRERAVGYLRKLAALDLSEGTLKDVMKELKRASGANEQEIARRADATLRHMLHHWGEVAISTIDAFTRRVARPFARDLQLDQALRMTTDTAWYQDRAVDALIAEAGTNGEVTDLLAEACRQLLHDEAKWDPAAPLRKLIAELDRETSIAHLEALHALDSHALLEITRKLRQETDAVRDRIRAIGREALRLIAREGLVSTDFYYTGGGTLSWFEALAEFGAAWMKPATRIETAIEKGQWHGGKAGSEAKARLASIAPELERLYLAGRAALMAEQRAYHLKRAVLRELPAAFALRELNRCLEALKRADGVAFFSDITRRVAQVMIDEPAPWILERVGERYRHYLIDEFQDTSLMQWRCLLPLIDNALASNGSALLVGDAKQAIYRWRNGEARLFTGFPALFGARGELDAQREAVINRSFKEGERLKHNHRSGSAIVEFNNALFAELKEALPEQLRGVYEAHEQEPWKKEPGFVRIRALDPELKGEALREAKDGYLLACVEEALRDGFAHHEIAVLVRGKRQGQESAEALVANGHAVSSPDGAKLSANPDVKLVVELLRVIHLNDPEAATRAWQLLSMRDAPVGTPFDPFKLLAEDAPIQRVKQWLKAHGGPGLRTTIASLTGQLLNAIGIDPISDGQLMALLDEAHGFGLDHGQDLGGFLEHWDRKGGERSIAMAGEGAITVMTIHKSKGLQFPVVIVPNAAMASRGQHETRLWVAEGLGFDGVGAALVKTSGAIGQLDLPAAIEEDELSMLDNLNLLYVAFTRPEQRLYAALPPRSTDSISQRLKQRIDRDGIGAEFIVGERAAPWKAKDAQPPLLLKAQPLPTSGVAVDLRFEAPEEWDPTDPDPMRRFGNLVHEALQRTTDAASFSTALRTMQREGLIDAAFVEELEATLGPVLRSPAMAPWFAAGLEVRSEATLITAEGQALRPDRVVLDGQTVRVLDYKTGAPSERHHEQVQGYLSVLRDMGHQHVVGALLYTRDGALQYVNLE